MPRAGTRSSFGGAGGRGNRVNVEGPMGRRCPRCEAAPGWRCGRYVGALWEPMKSFHAERRAAGRKATPGKKLVDATMTRPCLRLLDALARPELEEALADAEADSLGTPRGYTES